MLLAQSEYTITTQKYLYAVADTELSKPRILAVDDSRVMRAAITKILGQDYDVVEAEHGEDAWTLLINDETIQVVFTDLSMPYLDGYGLLERIRTHQDERIAQIPVIIITGKEDDDNAKEEALRKGATDFITKPFESITLKARAQAHVRYEQNTRRLSEISMILERQAAIDGITGLGGQRYFCKAADEKLAYLKRHNEDCIVVRIDIDNFNALFIKYGKKVADGMLEKIGEFMREATRAEDMAARIGLAKFAMMLVDTDMTTAAQVIERLRSGIEKMKFKIGDKLLRITISGGILQPELEKDSDIRSLLERTEAHMQQAMDAGGNQIRQFSELAATDIKEAKTQKMDIKMAIELLARGELDRVRPHADELLRELHPLLEFLSKEHEV